MTLCCVRHHDITRTLSYFHTHTIIQAYTYNHTHTSIHIQACNDAAPGYRNIPRKSCTYPWSLRLPPVQFTRLMVRSLVSALRQPPSSLPSWFSKCGCPRLPPVEFSGLIVGSLVCLPPVQFTRVMVGSSCILVLCACHPCNWPNWFSNCWSLRPPSVQFTKLILKVLVCAPAEFFHQLPWGFTANLTYTMKRGSKQERLEVAPFPWRQKLDDSLHGQTFTQPQQSKQLAKEPDNHTNPPWITKKSQSGVIIHLPFLFSLGNTRGGVTNRESHQNFTFGYTGPPPFAMHVDQPSIITILTRWKPTLVLPPSFDFMILTLLQTCWSATWGRPWPWGGESRKPPIVRHSPTWPQQCFWSGTP